MTAITAWRRSTRRRRQPSVHQRPPGTLVYAPVAGLGLGVVVPR